MKTLITIMAHAGAQDVFERHFPYWQEHVKEGAELLFIFPEGQAIRGIGHAYLEIGRAQHDGTQAILRFRSILEHISQLTYDQFTFLEYDSFILGTLPINHHEFCGNLFFDSNPEWAGRSFIHPPFMVDNHALRRIVTEIKRMPLDIERGMWDRMLGLATERADILRKSWIQSGYGYSQNTIHEAHFPDLHRAILKGGHAIHGVKDEACLKVIQNAWETRKQVDFLEKQGHSVTLNL